MIAKGVIKQKGEFMDAVSSGMILVWLAPPGMPVATGWNCVRRSTWAASPSRPR